MVQQVKKCERCGESFIPTLPEKRPQRFCSRNCGKKNWRQNNLSRALEIERRSYDKHREKRNAYERQRTKNFGRRNSHKLAAYRWAQRWPEKLRVVKQKCYQKGRREMSDAYIRGVITCGTKLPARLVPFQLLEVKRLYLQIHRQLKEISA